MHPNFGDPLNIPPAPPSPTVMALSTDVYLVTTWCQRVGVVPRASLLMLSQDCHWIRPMTPKQLAPEVCFFLLFRTNPQEERQDLKMFFLVKQSLKCFGVTTCSKLHVFTTITDTIRSNKIRKDLKSHKIKLFLAHSGEPVDRSWYFQVYLKIYLYLGSRAVWLLKWPCAAFMGINGAGETFRTTPTWVTKLWQQSDWSVEMMFTAISIMLHEQHRLGDIWYFFLMIPLIFHSAPWSGQNLICLLLTKKTTGWAVLYVEW